MPQDSMLTIGMLVVLALLIFFMFRNSRKRQKQAQELQSRIAPGVKVMTSFGLFGTVVSVNPDENKIDLEVSPGTVVTLLRPAVTRVVDEDLPVDESVDEVTSTNDDAPEYGERLDSSEPKNTDRPSES